MVPGAQVFHERARMVRARRRLRVSIMTRADPVKRVLTAFARDTAHSPVTFVQIGSNDGTTADPLRALTEAYGWSGVLVEPVEYVFARLRQERGSDPRLRFEHAAIADHDGEADFFHLRQGRIEEDLPYWHDQLGSFSLDTILSPEHETQIPEIRDLVVTATVKTLTFESLCVRHDLTKFHLLHIDTEGYDWEILSQIDLERYRPMVVLYEHKHLSPDDRQRAETKLQVGGYTWCHTLFDTIGVRRGALAPGSNLRSTWKWIERVSL